LSFSSIGKYKLLKRIGTGGFSEVWLAEKNNLQYAIKIPRIDVRETFSSKDFEMFLKEAEIWSKLSHKNIVKLYEYNIKPFPYIVMEYCKSSLKDKLAEIDVDTALTIVLKIADALEHAHYHGIVHRDIKPENILFCGDEPKISDWGIAKVLLRTSTRSGYTGTPLYSAPEQLDPESFGNVDWRTDIWQFGCLLYEMIEKEPPFYADYPGQLTNKILNKPPKPFKKTPEWLRRIISKCLEKEKNKRWRSISLVIERLSTKQEIREPTKRQKPKPKEAKTRITKQRQEVVEGLTPIKKVALVIDKIKQGTLEQIASLAGLKKTETKKLLETIAKKISDKEWVSMQEWERLKQEFNTLISNQFLDVNTIAKKLNISEAIVRSIADELGTEVVMGFVISPSVKLDTINKYSDIKALSSKLNTTPQILLRVFNASKRLKFTIARRAKVLEDNKEVYSIAWSPDGKYIASATGGSIIAKNVVRIWDVNEGIITISYKGPRLDEMVFTTWSPNGKYLVGCAYGDVKVWNIKYKSIIASLRDHVVNIHSATWSPDSKHLAIGFSCGVISNAVIEIWRITSKSATLVKKLKEGHWNIHSVAWSPDGKYIASGSSDGEIRIWNVDSEKIVKVLRGYTGNVLSVAWNPYGNYLAAGSAFEPINIWNVNSGRVAERLKGHTDEVLSVAWHPDGIHLASGSKDKRVGIWNADSGERIKFIDAHTESVKSVAWSPDGKYLASGSIDGIIKIWDVRYSFKKS